MYTYTTLFISVASFKRNSINIREIFPIYAQFGIRKNTSEEWTISLTELYNI